MQAFAPDSQMFSRDQYPVFAIELWDTPFTPLRNDIASGGIQFTMREPRHSDGAFGMLASLQGASASGAAAAFDAAVATTVVEDGRLPNLVGYWAAGAPGYHGASRVRQVAYHFEAWVRAGSGRDWFEPATTFTATVGAAGNGYLRVVKNGATDLVNATMSEKSYLLGDDGGGPIMSPGTSLTDGDKLDLYYVQDKTTWGGFVFKLCPGNVATGLRERRLAMREGAVIGCGLLDDDQSLTPALAKRTLLMVRDPRVNMNVKQTSRATWQVPLANTAVWDGIGWQWVRAGADAAGILRLTSFTDDGLGGVAPVTFNVKRQRLCRVRMGFALPDATQDLTTVFTGFTDDFADVASGLVTVSALGIEQRLVDQFVKNYPDKISYMSYGYQRLSGTSEPVWDVPAYDNWPIEFALRDTLVRAGIDESRTRPAQIVPLEDGTTTSVVM